MQKKEGTGKLVEVFHQVFQAGQQSLFLFASYRRGNTSPRQPAGSGIVRCVSGVSNEYNFPKARMNVGQHNCGWWSLSSKFRVTSDSLLCACFYFGDRQCKVAFQFYATHLKRGQPVRLVGQGEGLCLAKNYLFTPARPSERACFVNWQTLKV